MIQGADAFTMPVSHFSHFFKGLVSQNLGQHFALCTELYFISAAIGFKRTLNDALLFVACGI